MSEVITSSSTTPGSVPDARISQARWAWVDFAKGLCIIAVVALWVNRTVGAGQAGWIGYFVAFAKPFRMPDFFLISGLFLSRVVHRPWPHYLDTKVLHYLYFLLLWTLIIIPGMWVLKDSWPASIPAAMAEIAYGWLHPVAMLWFLMALSAYFVAARLLQGVPRKVVAVVAAALMLAAPETGISIVDWFSTYFVFFFCGCAYAERFFGLADWSRSHPRSAWTLISAWAVFNAGVIYSAGAQSPFVLLPLGFLGICALIMLSSLLCTRPHCFWLKHLGQNSIAVYLGFYLLMNAFLAAASQFPQLTSHRAVVASMIWVFSIAGSMALFHAIRHTPLRFLYARPAWARVTHWTSRSSS